MSTALPDRTAPRPVVLSARALILVAIGFGLCGGYLDLIVIIAKKYCWNDQPYFWSGRDFWWSVPLGHAALLAIPGILVAFLNGLRPGLVSLRAASWLFAALALWGALLRMPFYGFCSLILAIGLARPVSAAFAASGWYARKGKLVLSGLLGVLLVLAALSSGRHAIREYRAVAGLPPAPSGSRNVLLIVWDTVRSYSLSLEGYPRNTTPNFAEWARTGVRFRRAVAPAPWTYPSHSSFFTGAWPYQLNTQLNDRLDDSTPTLAEYLASRGYQTAGFAGNTNCVSYETGLDRGFAHYEDYPLTPWFFLGRTIPGRWLLKEILARGDFHAAKWIRLQSRDARGINDAFLSWLPSRRRDRPFFAFLNYFDAHDPFVAPAQYAGRFGARPKTPEDYQFLFDYSELIARPVPAQKVLMARDCYDDCVAFLDEQLGRLLTALRGEGLLENTLVIITSDHGEAFGDHVILGHGNSVYLDEIAVPLVVLAPGAPASQVVDDPVSLRDLPATVVDLLGLSAGAPFRGHSLAEFWRAIPGDGKPDVSRAFSEVVDARAFRAQPRNGLGRQGFNMSLVAHGHHYLRDGLGSEMLFDLLRDPFERVNIIDSPEGERAAHSFRKMLLDVLAADAGAPEVEKAYLKPCRDWLRSLVENGSPGRETVSAMTRGK